MKKICAIYTRKSTEERLDMEFNSLDAQREACEAYILSQRSEGWVAGASEYDDGGFSGGTLERPALERLLDDIKASKIHTVVVYKIDRLTRSLMDFSKLVEIFDAHGVTFVSVTQSFNTTTSMGRLTLNVLLSFAQFEREVTGERIRDKIAASKRKGMWMGGIPPIGYSIENRQLVVKPDEVPLARMIFERYLALGNVRELKQELDAKKILSPKHISLTGNEHGGQLFSRGALYSILRNPAYIGKIQHKDKVHEGLHEGIIDYELWQKVQGMMNGNAVLRTEITQQKHVLQGLVFDYEGVPYTPVFTARHNRQYRYYVSQNLLQYKNHPKALIARLPSHEIEQFIDTAVRQHIPAMWQDEHNSIRQHLLESQTAIPTFDLIRGMVSRVTIDLEQITITLKPGGLEKLTSRHFGLTIPTESLILDPIIAPYKTSRAKRGAVVIEPVGSQGGLLGLAPLKLKKFVQGVIWRDEHFKGLALKDIAKREGCSEAYVGTAIFSSFDILQKGFAAQA